MKFNTKLEDISLEFGMHTNYKGEGFIILGDSITIDSLNLLDLSDEIPFAEAKEEAGLVLSVCRDFSYRLGILKLNEKHKQ